MTEDFSIYRGVYVGIATLAIVGNILVLVSIYHSKRHKKVSSVMQQKASLAIVDLLSGLLLLACAISWYIMSGLEQTMARLSMMQMMGGGHSDEPSNSLVGDFNFNFSADNEASNSEVGFLDMQLYGVMMSYKWQVNISNWINIIQASCNALCI